MTLSLYGPHDLAEDLAEDVHAGGVHPRLLPSRMGLMTLQKTLPKMSMLEASTPASYLVGLAS